MKMGKFGARANDTPVFANKTFRCVWGLSFQASAGDDSGLLLEKLELISLRRRLLNSGRSLPHGSWRSWPSRAFPKGGGRLPEASWFRRERSG